MLDWVDGVTEGIAGGWRRLGEALLYLLAHPAATVRGAHIALADASASLEEWVRAGADYFAAWSVDPVGFAASSVATGVGVLACVLAAWGLEGVADRVAIACSRVFRDRSQRARRGRVGAITRLRRARAMRLEHRRGQCASGVRRVLQRIRWWVQDGVDGLRLLIAQPVPATVFMAERLGWTILRFAGRALRVGWQQIAYLTLPIVLLSLPWIRFSVHLDNLDRAVQRDIAPAAGRYLNDVADLPIAPLRVRTDNLRARYAEHRLRLLQPVSDLDAELDREMHALDRDVAAGRLAEQTIDHRLGGLLDRYGRRRLWMIEQIFLHPTRTAHGPYAPSHNWLESYRDEQALFEAARARSTSGETRRYLDRAIAALEAQLSYESCILRDDPGKLLERPLPPAYSGCGESPAYGDGSRP